MTGTPSPPSSPSPSPSPSPPPKGTKVATGRVKKPAAKKPAVTKPAVKKPAVKKPAVKKATKTKKPKDQPKTAEELQEKLDKVKTQVTNLRRQKRSFEHLYNILRDLSRRAEDEEQHPEMLNKVTQTLCDYFAWEDLVAEFAEVEKRKGFRYKTPEGKVNEYQDWAQTRVRPRGFELVVTCEPWASVESLPSETSEDEE